MDKIAITASAKKLISLYGKGDSWKFMSMLQRLVSGGPKKLTVPTKIPLQLNKFMRNRANDVASRFESRVDNMPVLKQLYILLTKGDLDARIMDPARRGNIAYLKRLREHLKWHGFKAVPGNKMQWQLPPSMQQKKLYIPQKQFLKLIEDKASIAAGGALSDPVIGRYSPYRAQTKGLSYKKLFQPEEYSQYAPSKLQQLLQDAGIKSLH